MLSQQNPVSFNNERLLYFLGHLLEVGNECTLIKECSPKEAEFLTSKSRVITVPHSYII
jgi:hypothetical protein